METLVLALLTWISAHTGLSPVDTVPEIAFETPGAIEARNVSDTGYRSEGDASRTVALYDLERQVIHLPVEWSERDPIALSILVHELVHHVQVVTEQEYRCRGAMEKVAYDAQIAFLESMGIDMFEAMGMNRLFYAIVTTCDFNEFQ